MYKEIFMYIYLLILETNIHIYKLQNEVFRHRIIQDCATSENPSEELSTRPSNILRATLRACLRIRVPRKRGDRPEGHLQKVIRTVVRKLVFITFCSNFHVCTYIYIYIYTHIYIYIFIYLLNMDMGRSRPY